MEQKIIQKLENELNEEKEKIEKELLSIAKKDPKFEGDYDTRFPDLGQTQSADEAALEVSAYASTLPLEYHLELKMAAINGALAKIKQNKYGVCEKCGKEISLKRLKIFPEAKYCIECS